MERFLRQFLFIGFVISLKAFAQENTTPLAMGGDFLAILDKIKNFIPLEGAVIMVGAGILDFILRMVKTETPKSVMYLIADGMKGVAGIIMKAGEFLDKILPQRLK